MPFSAKRKVVLTSSGLGVLLLIAIGGVVVMSPDYQQAQAVSAIRRSSRWSPAISSSFERVPRWARGISGWRCFSNVYAVNISLDVQMQYRLPEMPPLVPFTDTDLQRLLPELQRLAYLQRLGLSGTSVSDDGVKGLATLEGLRVLDLSGTAITDAAIPDLAAIPALEQIDLDETSVSAEGRRSLLAQRPGVVIHTIDNSGPMPPLP